jgi:hypothetical protein
MTCTAPCTAPAPHTQKPAPHLHRTGCVLSPYNPLRCVQGCTASRRLAGTLYALVASRDETDSRAAPPRAEIWPTSVTCPRCTVRRRRPSTTARFSVGSAAHSSPRTSRCYRQARSSSGHILAPAPIGTMRGVLSVASVSAIANASAAATAVAAGRSCGDCATDPRIDQFPFDTLLLFF